MFAGGGGTAPGVVLKRNSPLSPEIENKVGPCELLNSNYLPPPVLGFSGCLSADSAAGGPVAPISGVL